MRIGKLAIFAFFAVLIATTICSSVYATYSPQSLLLELQEKIKSGDDMLFRGYVITYTHQQKNALSNKINALIELYDDGNYDGNHDDILDKLKDDLAPKLTDPHDADGHPSARAKSWLYMYPDDCPDRRAVTGFAAECQELIALIISLTNEGPIE